jgi:hypothetical protein
MHSQPRLLNRNDLELGREPSITPGVIHIHRMTLAARDSQACRGVGGLSGQRHVSVFRGDGLCTDAQRASAETLCSWLLGRAIRADIRSAAETDVWVC